jgi:hypothetical protein
MDAIIAIGHALFSAMLSPLPTGDPNSYAGVAQVWTSARDANALIPVADMAIAVVAVVGFATLRFSIWITDWVWRHIPFMR